MAALGRLAVAVVLPARDESGSIVTCLQAILTACDRCVSAQRCWVVVVADQCEDDTVELASKTLGPRGEVLLCEAGAAGAARRIGCAAALRHLTLEGYQPNEIWLANTDADTAVPCHWLEQQLTLARIGARGIAGTVSIPALRHRGRDISPLLMDDYMVRADGSHGHVHGANLGIAAEAYLDVGGWSAAALAEDHCLWSRLQARGWPLTATATLCVQTSARLRGRAEGGFASTLSKKVETLCG